MVPVVPLFSTQHMVFTETRIVGMAFISNA